MYTWKIDVMFLVQFQNFEVLLICNALKIPKEGKKIERCYNVEFVQQLEFRQLCSQVS